MSEQKFPLNLRPQRWYTWEMLPGYTDSFDPYVSPVYILGVKPLKTGKGLLKIGFYNALYATGVKGFQATVKVLKHTPNYMLADLTPSYDGDNTRSAVIGRMSYQWLESRLRFWFYDVPPHHLPQALDGVHDYLTHRLLRDVKPTEEDLGSDW